jgi:uncharacterized protein (DUF1330 family)
LAKWLLDTSTLAHLMPLKAGASISLVVIEFDSVAKAVEVHDSAAYQAALAALKGGVLRDVRIVEAV